MKTTALEYLVCPIDKHTLELTQQVLIDSEVESGQLKCSKCEKIYVIQNGIPNFTSDNNYTDNFGFQWNKFSKTQLDSHTGIPISEKRFFQVTGWSSDCSKQIGIEVGSGAGRFTEIAASTGIELFTLDASTAIYANKKNNGSRYKNINFIRADLRSLPFKNHSFDKAICLGVIQHTPNPKNSFLLISNLIKRKDSHFAFDVYSKTWETYFWSKYWLRPITKRMPQKGLFNLIQLLAPLLIFIHDCMRFIPIFGRKMAYLLVPVCNYKYTYPLNKIQNKEWAILDTFDMLSPEFDIPCSIDEINSWVNEINPNHKNIQYGPNGVIANIGY
jgi:uncharacterized protein YbaR (Trm112 family)